MKESPYHAYFTILLLLLLLQSGGVLVYLSNDLLRKRKPELGTNLSKLLFV